MSKTVATVGPITGSQPPQFTASVATKLLSIFFQIQASAAAQTRTVVLEILDNSGVSFAYIPLAQVTANKLVNITVGPGLSDKAAMTLTVSALDAVCVPMPPDLTLNPGWHWALFIDNLDTGGGGDTYSYSYEQDESTV